MIMDVCQFRHVRLKDFLFDLHQIVIEGGRGVIVIVVGYGHGDTSSNPGRD